MSNRGLIQDSKKQNSSLRAISMRVCLFLILSTGIFAQSASTGPSVSDDTELILPDVIIDLEDPQLTLDADVISEETNLEFQRDLLLSPDFASLDIDPSIFISSELGGGSTTGNARSSSPLFFNAKLGLGLSESLFATMNLFSVEEKREYELSFGFSTSDGSFYGQDYILSGNGYKNLTADFNGYGSWINSDSSVYFEATADIRNLGLQQISSTLTNQELRSLGVKGDFSFLLKDLWYLNLDLGSSWKKRDLVQPNASPSNEQIYEIDTLIGISYENDFRFAFDLFFDFNGFEAYANQYWLGGDLELSYTWEDQDNFSLFASTSPRFFFDGAFYMPFDLGLKINFTDGGSMAVSGGYDWSPINFYELWLETPFLINYGSSGSSLSPNLSFFGKYFGNYFIGSELEIISGLEYRYWETLNQISNYNSASQQNSLSVVSDSGLSLEAGINIRPDTNWRIGILYEANFLTYLAIKTAHEIDFQLSYNSDEWGFHFNAMQSIWEEYLLPNIQTSIYINASPEIALELGIKDLLAFGFENGRSMGNPSLSPLVGRGFMVEFLTIINF